MQALSKPTVVLWATMPAINFQRVKEGHPLRRIPDAGATLAAYLEAQEQVLLSPRIRFASGAGIQLLDMLTLTQRCGKACTTDGVHPLAASNEATIQVVASIWDWTTRSLSETDACASRQTYN